MTITNCANASCTAASSTLVERTLKPSALLAPGVVCDPNAPNSTFVKDRFIALLISTDKMKPDDPSSEPLMIRMTFPIAKPGAPAEVVLAVDGQEVARTAVKRTVPAAFTASETFDVGVDLGSPVSLDYFDRRPFKFDGKIASVKVQLK